MSAPAPSFSVKVDVTNPGQFFACCGLLELAHRLWPGTEGWFALSNGRFEVRVPTNGILDEVVKQLTDCAIEGLTADERAELARLERKRRTLRKDSVALSPAEEERRSELGRRTREGRLVLKGFQLTLDWWQEDDTPATWAGKQEIHKIARAAQDGVAQCVSEGCPLEEMLDWQLVLRTPKEYNSGASVAKKVEPFYFDARRYAHALDAGFSLDVQGAETAAHPATELLCLIGLQRFRPRRDEQDRRKLQYYVWPHALGVTQAAAAAGGSVFLPGARRLCFAMRFRDDQRRYKAFGFAKELGASS